MALDATANFVRGNTDAAVDATQTTVSVSNATIFPDPSTEGEYNVVIWDAANFPRPDQDSDVEVMRVTARDTTNDDLTVTRGQEGTTGASHPSGAAIHLSVTAKMFGDIDSQKLGDGENFDGQGTSTFSNVASVSTGKADITNESLVDVYLGANQSISAGTNTTLQLDTKQKDEKSEFDTTSHQFTPTDTGFYLIAGFVRFGGGASGDEISVRFEDITGGSRIFFNQTTRGGSGSEHVNVLGVRELIGGNSHEIQVQNANSNDTISGVKSQTYLTVRSAFR